MPVAADRAQGRAPRAGGPAGARPHVARAAVHNTGSIVPAVPMLLVVGALSSLLAYMLRRRRLAEDAREARAAARTRALTTLLDVSRHVNSTLELQPLLGVILESLKTVVDYTGAAILLQQGDELVFFEYRGPLPRAQVLSLRLPLSDAPGYLELLRRREPFFVDDIWGQSEGARIFRSASARLRETFGPTHSWMGLPLTAKDHMIGMLRLDHRERGRFSAYEAWLAQAVANQAAVAIENARLYERARELAVLQERQRMARELHDSVSQVLYGIELGAQTARELLAGQMDGGELREALAEPIDYVGGLAEAGLAEMRALLFELRPESLASEGLVAGLNKQVASVQARYHLDVQSDFGAEPDVPLDVKETIYRIVQEALQNVVRHARARQARLRLSNVDGRIRIEVADDGVGFDPAAAHPGHLGLQTMRERAGRLGGTLAIRSSPGAGTLLQVELPRRYS